MKKETTQGSNFKDIKHKSKNTKETFQEKREKLYLI